MGTDGTKLLEKPVCVRVPRLLDNGMYSDLRRIGSEHDSRHKHQHGDMVVHGLYSAAVLYPV